MSMKMWSLHLQVYTQNAAKCCSKTELPRTRHSLKTARQDSQVSLYPPLLDNAVCVHRREHTAQEKGDASQRRRNHCTAKGPHLSLGEKEIGALGHRELVYTRAKSEPKVAALLT